ncbi:MAG: hypothetical protein EOM53_00845 [Alphaproteobacteria bacterium]|nr:hypothetical protein [Alphaproteobacteria bacterium]
MNTPLIKEFEFFHATLDTNALKSFYREGAKAIGKGWFGQKDGFYTWPSLKRAKEHAIFLDDKYEVSFSRALIIGVKVKAFDLHYPLWQIDLETTNPLDLFDLHKEKLEKLNLPYKSKRYGECFITIESETTNPYRKIKLLKKDGSLKSIFTSDIQSYPEALEAVQAINEALCKYPDYRKDYDKKLYNSIVHKEEAVKYTGKTPLLVSRILFTRIKEDNTGLSTLLYPLYEREISPQKQTCPFVNLKLFEKGCYSF